MSEPTWSFSQNFTTEFQAARNDLQARIDSINASTATSNPQDVLNELSIAISKLSKRLADATPSLPTYDQRQYNEQLKALEFSLAELRTKAVPKSKFAFKKKAAKPASASTPATLAPTPGKESLPPAAQPTFHAETFTLSSQSNKVLSWESVPELTGRNDVTITNLTRCIVDFASDQKGSDEGDSESRIISAVHIDNLKDTVLILPVIEGSVLAHSLERCTIVVGCRQFRMHNSHSVDVYLSVPSNPVIEQCDAISFTGYPEDLARNQEVHKPSKHHDVLDFTHILPTPSPHWSALPDERKLVVWNHRRQLDEVLDTYLPPSA